MKKWFTVMIAVVAMGAGVGSVGAAEGGNVATSNTTPSFILTPFDDKVATLPQGFIGHNLKRLYQVLKQKIKPRGEFESTKDYQDRIGGLATRPLLGSVTFQSALAVSIDLKGLVNYNADGQKFEVGLDVGRGLIDMTERDTVEWPVIHANLSDEKITGRYVGQNAYGAKTEVLQVLRQTYDILIQNKERFSRDAGENVGQFLAVSSINLTVPMAAAKAKAAKTNLRALIVFKLAPPFIREDEDYAEPNLDRPVELMIDKHYVCSNINSIWIYNVSYR